MSTRTCARCTYVIPKTGIRCKLNACTTGPRCWQHTKIVEGVRVKQSTVPQAGLGLFASRSFTPNQFVSTYSGEEMTEAQLRQRYENTPYGPFGVYTMEVGRDRYVDARNSNSGNARYINDARGTGKSNNTRITKSADSTRKIKTTKHVAAGSEFFVNYGREYWKK
jgi:SET domain-containing protein